MDKMAKSCMRITKSIFLGAKQWRGHGGEANFFSSGGNLPVPLLRETLLGYLFCSKHTRSLTVVLKQFFQINKNMKQFLGFRAILFCQFPQNKQCINCSSTIRKATLNVYNFPQPLIQNPLYKLKACSNSLICL